MLVLKYYDCDIFISNVEKRSIRPSLFSIKYMGFNENSDNITTLSIYHNYNGQYFNQV